MLSACSEKAAIYKDIKRECFMPKRPVLEMLNENEHIGSHENVRRLLANVIDLTAYAAALEAAVKCYGDK